VKRFKRGGAARRHAWTAAPGVYLPQYTFDGERERIAARFAEATRSSSRTPFLERREGELVGRVGQTATLQVVKKR